jgi:hypothetical protein
VRVMPAFERQTVRAEHLSRRGGQIVCPTFAATGVTVTT